MTGLMRLCPSWRSNRTKGLRPGGMRIDRSEMLWHPARGNNQGDPRGFAGKSCIGPYGDANGADFGARA